MVLGRLPVLGRPTIWLTVGQGPTALAVGTGGGCLDIFTLIYPFSSLSPSLWETVRYRLKYCLKGPLNQNNQPTNQLSNNRNLTVVNLSVFFGTPIILERCGSHLIFCDKLFFLLNSGEKLEHSNSWKR